MQVSTSSHHSDVGSCRCVDASSKADQRAKMPYQLQTRSAIGYRGDRQGCGRATTIACYCVGGETAKWWELTACIGTIMPCRLPEDAAMLRSLCRLRLIGVARGMIFQYRHGDCLQTKSIVCSVAHLNPAKEPPEAAPPRSALSSYL